MTGSLDARNCTAPTAWTASATGPKADTGDNYAVAWIDGKMGQKFRLNSKESYYLLADGL